MACILAEPVFNLVLLFLAQLSTESADSGEHASVGGASSTGASSDVSWEQVEEREAQITLWMPDHAVTHCAACDNAFNVVRRKHHCRCVSQ